jgi:membrane protein YdbS with pleckstrin-like domain
MMKYIIWFFFIVSVVCIASGYFLDVSYSQKLIGVGVVVLFFVVFPLFSYYRWKDKKVEDYMITKENIDKMRNHEK